MDGLFCYFSLMLILYKIAITFYEVVILIFSAFNSKAKKFRDGRKDWEERLKEDFQGNEAKVVWIHAASLGEFEQGRPIIEAIRKSKPEVKILLTFFSPSGFEVRKNYDSVHWVHYLPLDKNGSAEKFVSIVKPSLAIFIKYEFWYFFLKKLNEKEVPTIMVSSIFRKNQLFFHWSGAFFKPIFQEVDHFFVQDEESAGLISTINEKVTIAGDTRFDRVIEISDQASTFEPVEEFLRGEKCFMVGSSWSSDLKVLQPFIEKYQSKIKFVIAPHNINDEEIASIESRFAEVGRFSKPVNLAEKRILVIDNMGMLSSLYKYADYAFIGGGFRGALHNTLEAAVYGIPIFFGDHENNEKFREAIELAEIGAAFPVSSDEDLEQRFESMFQNIEVYKPVALAAFDYVRSKSGATQTIMKKIKKLI